jgi:phage tail sheath protein FI
MPFQLSPGVNVTEIDLTTVIPAVATTDAAIGGVFKWGPVDKPSLVVSETELAEVYGKPDSDNAETFFTAASFLAYSNRLHVSRAHHSTGTNVRVNAYAENGYDYLVVDGTNSGVNNLDAISQIIDGIESDTTVLVDTSDVVFNSGDTAATINATSDTIVVNTPLTIFEGEQVFLSSANVLPTAVDNVTPYFLVDVASDRLSFKLSATQGGSAINFVAGQEGNGDMTLTRTGQTRISLVGSTYSGTTGSFDFEFHNPQWSFNAVANNVALSSTAKLSNHVVKNEDHYAGGLDANFDDSVLFIAKYPGALGNSLKVSVCDSASAFNSTVTVASGTTFSLPIGSNTVTVTASTNTAVSAVIDELNVGDLIKVGNSEIGMQYLEVTAINPVGTGTSTTLGVADNLAISESVSINNGSFQRYWGYWGVVDGAPGQSSFVAAQGNTAANDEIHVVVVDEDGAITGIPNNILEVWSGMSRATDAKSADGGNLYYKDVINQSSKWIWWANDSSAAPSATSALIASSTATAPISMSMRFGRDIGTETSASMGDILRAYDKFKSAEDMDISLVLTGKSRGGSTTNQGRIVEGFQLANYLIDNIAETRKDCVVFCSPEKEDVVANVTDITEDVTDFRSALRSTSYAVMDSGYKYMYDKYNDVYRWIPLNGDIAGLCANTDNTRDPWYSPAGFNRGNIKNVIKLAWNPKKGERDLLYSNGVNPIVNFPGQGIIMFGDKTLLAKPSAFDRINVRRLFIVLEKAIATAAKFTLFEFNDEFTRASFVNLVTPYLRDVQGRRGITDFLVVSDETNNTGEVIDRNEFVGDIYIKPARSINFIQLNFVAVRSGVEFSEVVGNF